MKYKIMETKKNIAQIATNLLNSEIEYTSITEKPFVLPCNPGDNLNNYLFVKRAFDLYFYTEKSMLADMLFLKKDSIPTYVVLPGSNKMYELKK